MPGGHGLDKRRGDNGPEAQGLSGIWGAVPSGIDTNKERDRYIEEFHKSVGWMLSAKKELGLRV